MCVFFCPISIIPINTLLNALDISITIEIKSNNSVLKVNAEWHNEFTVVFQ